VTRRILIAAAVAFLVLLAVNTIVTDRETKPARADIGRVVKLSGGDIQVREDGSRRRPTIVLLHGFAASMHWWTPATLRLARRFHVVRVDLLGHGGSEKPRHGYSMPDQARLVAHALDRIGVRHAVVVGHSMGGSVATALAEQEPKLVDAVATVDSPPTKHEGHLPFLARLGFVPVMGEAIRRVVPDELVKKNLEKAFASGFDVPDQFVHDFGRMTYTSYDDSADEAGDFSEKRGLADRLARTGKPLLAIFGDKDDLVDPDSAPKYQRVPGAKIEIVPGAGHCPMFEKPDRTAALIADFARRVER
jgi:pimeloyl-ACP methyl ester carboxylesterase